jgi:hypothetical protein
MFRQRPHDAAERGKGVGTSPVFRALREFPGDDRWAQRPVELSEGITPPAGLQNRACHVSGTRLLDRSDSCHEHLVYWSVHVVPRVSGHDSDGERPLNCYRRCADGPN